MATKQNLDTVYVFSNVASRRPAPQRGMKRAAVGSERPQALPKTPEEVGSVPLDILKNNVNVATEQIRHLFEHAFQKTFGQYNLDAVELSLEISADGKVGFFGSHVGLSGKSGITLSFKRGSDAKVNPVIPKGED